jgi:nitrite reductase (NADH) large subunit
MKIVIAGNGLAGTLAAKALRELDDRAEINLFAAERHPYYPRPNLIEYLAGSLPLNRLFAFPEKWYGEHRIEVSLSSPVARVLPAEKAVEIDGGRRVPFDALLLANGASSFLPPVSGGGRNGVFTLRTLDDADRILEYHASHPRIVVLGGGLLGLEIARAMHARGADVLIAEFLPSLLPRQLDPRGSELLKAVIERLGIRVLLGRAAEEFPGNGEVRGVRFKGGEEIPADLVVVAAGVRPNLGLARDAGLQTDRGVLVDDFLQTSAPAVFAAGDGIQHRGQTYGIIPAAFEQARIAAVNILGGRTAYGGTTPSNTLKVAGIHLTTVGRTQAPPEGGEEISWEDPERDVYKKIVLERGRAAGAIWMGTKAGAQGITRAVLRRAEMDKWKRDVFDEEFDFSVL